jgi:hypothetical protein
LAGAGSFVAAAFFHWRHQYLDKRLPALGKLVLLTVWVATFIALGASSWWFKATKDNDAFNILTVTTIFSTPSSIGQDISRFVRVTNIVNEIEANPVSLLINLQINNKQTIPAALAGISLEVSSERWWPSWTKLCRVDLSIGQLMWINIGEQDGTLLSPKNALEYKAIELPIAPHDNVVGWTAWECPKGNKCEPQFFRIAVIDTAGLDTWQIIRNDGQPISLNLLRSKLEVIGPGLVPLKNIPFKKISSCRK